MTRRLLTRLLVLVAVTLSTAAYAAEVPHYVNFQSVLRDDAGNLVEDGFIDLQLKILDQDKDVVYEETQPGVQVVRSAINVMIGEGVKPGSSPSTPTGGIPVTDLDPEKGTHFLQVQFGSNQPSDPMELGSVPYAMYAERALGLAPTTPPGNLPDYLVTQDELNTAIQNHENDTTAHPASSITVTGPFTTITGTTVQQTLQSIDSTISNINNIPGILNDAKVASTIARDSEVTSAVNTEASNRSTADAGLQGQINSTNSRIDMAHNPDGTIKGAGYSGIGIMVSYSIVTGTNVCSSCPIDPAHPNGCLPVGFSTSDCGTAVQFVPIVQRGGENGGSGGMSILDVYLDSSFILHIQGDGAERPDATATMLAIGTR